MAFLLTACVGTFCGLSLTYSIYALLCGIGLVISLAGKNISRRENGDLAYVCIGLGSIGGLMITMICLTLESGACVCGACF